MWSFDQRLSYDATAVQHLEDSRTDWPKRGRIMLFEIFRMGSVHEWESKL